MRSVPRGTSATIGGRRIAVEVVEVEGEEWVHLFVAGRHHRTVALSRLRRALMADERQRTDDVISLCRMRQLLLPQERQYFISLLQRLIAGPARRL